MKFFDFTLTANYRLKNNKLPSREDQYSEVWRFASFLSEIGIPLDQWYPPADTPENSRLNRSFDLNGVTPAALALARSDKDNDGRSRYLGAWNGIEEGNGGMVLESAARVGRTPASFSLDSKEVRTFADGQVAVRTLEKIIDIWKPICIQAGPAGYHEHKVFNDRPGVGWMVYLPLAIQANQVSEASRVVPIFDENKQQNGTLIVSVTETFDVDDPEHVKRANAIEIRLADQDLLPTNLDLVLKY